jgi:hypothetical protein
VTRPRAGRRSWRVGVDDQDLARLTHLDDPARQVGRDDRAHVVCDAVPILVREAQERANRASESVVCRFADADEQRESSASVRGANAPGLGEVVPAARNTTVPARAPAMKEWLGNCRVVLSPGPARPRARRHARLGATVSPIRATGTRRVGPDRPDSLEATRWHRRRASGASWTVARPPYSAP